MAGKDEMEASDLVFGSCGDREINERERIGSGGLSISQPMTVENRPPDADDVVGSKQRRDKVFHVP